MNRTYIAFYKAKKGKFLDKLISFIDGSPYSHVELIIGHIKNNTYDCISSSARDGGLRRKTINLNPDKWVLVPVKCDLNFAVRWYNKRKKFKYDYLALIRTKIPWFFNPTYKVFCSEAVAEMLELVDPASYGIKKLYQETIK